MNDLTEFSLMKAVYAEYIGTDNAPARSTQYRSLPCRKEQGKRSVWLPKFK